MSYTTEDPPKGNEIHQVVINIKGPVDEKAFKEFQKCLYDCVKKVRGSIGLRGRITLDGRFVKVASKSES